MSHFDFLHEYIWSKIKPIKYNHPKVSLDNSLSDDEEVPATTATPETTAASAKVENVTESVLTKSLSIRDPAPMVNSTTNPSTVDEQTTTAIITTINQIVTTIAPTTTAEVDSDPNCRKLIQDHFTRHFSKLFWQSLDSFKVFLMVHAYTCKY